MNLPIPSRVAFGTRIISDLSRPSRASSAAAHLPIPIICALRKAAHWDVRSATSGSLHSVEAIIARARLQQYHNVIGGIDATNGVSIALHTRLGFEFCGRVKHAGYKFGRWLDLDFYQLILDTPAQPVDG